MPHNLPPDLIDGLRSGDIVPYLGAGALAGAVDVQTGAPIPADSDSLILAMKDGKPMAPRLMYEFPRAAMNLELKRARSQLRQPLPDEALRRDRMDPRADFIASDADYVDYITELMGGFAIPSFLKEHRKGKCYLLLGMRFTRDTERMVMSDIVHGHGEPTGWALIEQPTAKEERFCEHMDIRIVRAGFEALQRFAQSRAA